MADNIEKKPFGKVRSMLFPIYGHECKKLIPLALIFLAVSMTYAMLRGLKDVYVINNMGSDSIYCLKVLVIPSIIFFTIIYTNIAKKVDGYTRFNIVFGYFLSFLLLFSLVLLPFCDALKLNGIADFLITKFPKMSGWWEVIRVWPVSLLYINAEAYGTMALGVAFWTFANSIFSSAQARRMYGFLSSGAAVGALLSGVIMLNLSDHTNLLFFIAVASLIFIIVLYNYLVGRIKADPVGYEIEEKTKKSKSKVKLTFAQSIACLMKSKYLTFMTFIVLGYNMFIALLESIWKGKVGIYKKEVVTNYLNEESVRLGIDLSDKVESAELVKAAKAVGQEATAVIYAYQSIATGLLSLFLIFFVASSMSKKSWKMRALFTPVVSLTLSAVFYLLFKNMGILKPLADSLDKSTILMFVLFGLGILVFIKSSKYIFFDTSKEQAYIPLDEDSKVNGKAAIDAIGSRFGKGLSSVMISLVLGPLFGGLEGISNITFILIFIVIGMWLFSVICLSPLYEQKVLEKEKERIEEENNKQKQVKEEVKEEVKVVEEKVKEENKEENNDKAKTVEKTEDKN